MKFKTFSLTSFAAIALLSFAACSSTEDVTDPVLSASAKTVRISIIQGDASTKALSGAAASNLVNDNEGLTISTGGHLFFVNEVGSITKYVKILVTGQNSLNLGTEVGIDALKTGGAIIEDVSSSSKRVYIYLNLPTSVTGISTALVNGPFSVVSDKLITASELAGVGVEKVPVSGSGPLTTVDNPDYGLETTVTLKAVAARIEIPKVSVIPSPVSGYTIASFKLAGIFINNFFHQSTLGGLAPADLINTTDLAGTSDAIRKLYYPTDASFYFTAANHAEKLYTADSDAGLGGSTLVKEAGAGKAWAYNVFPNEQAADATTYLPLDAVNTKAYLPHIVFHFSEVTLESAAGAQSTLTNQFVTVNGFNDGSSLDYLQRGYIYRFDTVAEAGLEISPDDLAPEPEQKTINAKVTAVLTPWALVTDITPEF
ncbi:MAG: hypothetical protein LBQ65_01315 [Tannerellaceae bacterium]|jgi:hypothetical protein|nr:hypothetical protein [Tannerellaceae bacterium]